jgi:23S rRNA pseudouridine1911/1915/1917 synthase
VVVDKPPAMPSTAGATRGPSVAALLLARFPEMAAIDERRAAGLVHRLDTGTSGLLVAARNPVAYGRLRGLFARKRVAKDYLAVVRGRLERRTAVAGRLDRHPRRRGRVQMAERGAGWVARTEVEPLLVADALSLVRLRMRTGVTHQLRVHMALLGHPVAADSRYGKVAAEALTASERRALVEGWHYLHAAALHFDDAERRPLVAPFPRHWRALFRELGWRENAARLDGGR